MTNRLIALLLTWAIPGSSAQGMTPPAIPMPTPGNAVAAGLRGAFGNGVSHSASDSPDTTETAAAVPSELVSPATAAPALGSGSDDEGVLPILECVVRQSSSSYIAYFGFKNETSQAISIPVGSNNGFFPAPQNRNQPTSFPRGRSPFYPNAAFAVPFSGSNLTWSLRGPDKQTRTVTAKSSSPSCQAPPVPTPTPTATPTPIPSPTPFATCANPVLNTRRYTRTSGVCNGHGHGGHNSGDDDNGPTVYLETFLVPLGSTGPYTLRVVNGDSQGRNKATSAEVKINGVQIVRESDFSNTVVSFTKAVAALLPVNAVYVRVAGAPGSTFTIEICGSNPNADTTPPNVDWLTPLEGALTNDPSPLLRVRYSDLVSAPNLSTLKVHVDAADRTDLFNKQPDEASADGAIVLPDGAHTLRAEIKDQAGNVGVGIRNFRVDATAPTLAITAPAAGAVLNITRPQIRAIYSDTGTLPSGVNTAMTTIKLDGVDVSAAFTRTPTEATGQPPAALANEPHLLEVTVADAAGNLSTVSRSFFVDTIAPVITGSHPAAGQVFNTSSVAIAVQYSDNQELNLESFSAAIDGVSTPLLVDSGSASGTSPPLADGSHTLVLSIADRAGNVQTATIPFSVDANRPAIAILTPPNGVVFNDRSPEILATFSDPQGIASGSLRITVNGVDRTADFTTTTTDARATLPDPLPEGVNAVTGEVRDLAGNVGTATALFTVDVTAPAVSVVSPLANAYLKDATPSVSITLSDALAGIEPGATVMFVDEVNVTALFAVGPDGATGTLSTPLAEGAHTLRVVAADRASNPTMVETTFHVDLTAPTLDIASPGGFTNDATPEVWLRTADPAGLSGALASGVDAASIRVYLLSEDPMEPDTDITALLTFGGADRRGEFTTALIDGSHRLRAVARDLAGNEAELTVGFVVDTVAPQLTIDQPQSGTFIPTAEPVIVLVYADERSGIAQELVEVKIDGVERAASLIRTATGATLTLSRSMGLDLSDGPHQVDARVVDQAGNATDAVTINFGVDTVAPTAVVLAPANLAFVGSATPGIHFTLNDAVPSSGVNLAFAKVFLDGVDVTTSLTLTTTGGGATGLPLVVDGTGAAATPLSDGTHILRITGIDNATNAVELISRFTVDTLPPTVTPEIPEEGRTAGGEVVDSNGMTTFTGSIDDSDPGLTVTCTAGGVTVTGTISNGSYSCNLPVVEGVNTITVNVTDSTGHTTTITRILIIDRTAPVVTIDSPTANEATAAQVLTVTGHVQDATAVTVLVNGISAVVTPAPAPGAPALFVATNVPVGSGTTQSFTAVAKDAGGNTGQALVSVVVDRAPPLVTITKPSAGAYVRAGLVSVEVDVTDRTATLLEVNGVVGFDPVCSGQTGGSVTCHFIVSIPLVSDGAIVATAVDGAGNVGRAQMSAILDSTPPNIVVTAPAALLTTNSNTLLVSGLVTDASPVTLTVNGQPVPVAADGAFSFNLAQDILGQPLSSLEGARDIVFLATDAAGNESTQVVPMIFDRTPPALTIAAPLSGAILTATPVSVSGTVIDATAVTVTVQGIPATSVGQAYSATLSGAPEGPFSIVVRAVDAAGNEATLNREVEVDLSVPTVTITTPANGSLTREATVSLTYSVLDRSPTMITVNGTAATPDCPGVNPCERTQVVNLAEGDNTLVVEATERVSSPGQTTGRSTSAEITVTRDSTPPVVELVASETVSRGRTATASASATDNLNLDHLEVRVGTGSSAVVICTGGANCAAEIPLPESARPGDSLTVVAIATDRAGNTTTVTRSVRVTADGVVTGTVLDDTTSLPIAGASVRLLTGASPRSVTTDAQGRYNLPVADTSATLRIERTGLTSVDRVISVASGVGTVPIDARLTPLAPLATQGPIVPNTNAAPGPLSLAVPGGSHRVTLLSPQGLPNLLPPGFSPVAAFDWATDGASTGARVTIAVPSGSSPLPESTLVRYDTAMRDWRIVAAGLVGVEGLIAVDLAGPGAYALVVADAMTPPLAIGPIGDALAGLSVVNISNDATSEGRVDPAVLPPSGGTATGTLRIDSLSALPSGTIVQADVDETYTLSSGEEASAPKRSMDIVVYKSVALSTSWATAGSGNVPTACAPATPGGLPAEHLCATFPITPSRTYSNTGLRDGRVHIDLLAGRENARGVVGGNAATSATSGAVRLRVAAGSLSEDTAMAVTAHDTFSSFIPTGNGVTPLAEVTVDFFGATLNTSASLTFENIAAVEGDALVLARVDRAAFDAIPRLQVVALADVWSQGGASTTSVVTRVDTGLAGVALEGITTTARYVLFKLAGPLAFIAGTTTAGGNPVRALVSSNSLPFVATSSTAGYYAIPANHGAVALSARVLGQSLLGATQVTATSGTPVTANIALEGTVTQATVTPASGATNVEVNEPLSLTSPLAIDPATVSAANVHLRSVPADPDVEPAEVALRLVLSGSGKQLSIIPFVPPTDPPTVPPPPALTFSTDYVLEITGLQDAFGGLITAPTTTFRTKADVKPVIDLTAITFSLPDADGLVRVSAVNGALLPGTTVLIINGGNGVVVSLTAGNDGQLSGTFPAAIDDLLFITVTDPFGNATSFQRSEFVDPVTGETAVGAFGGTVRGPQGSALEIPEGALNKGTKFKLDFVTPDSLEQRFPGQQPSFGVDGSGQPISHVGGALKVEVTLGEPKSAKEIDLVFPVPANLPAGADPKKAFYYVYQRVQGPCLNNAPTCAEGERQYFLRTLDHAFIECEDGKAECPAPKLRVKTASPPFNGFDGALEFGSAALFPVAASMNYLIWTFNELMPGKPLAGVITGYVYQPERVRLAGVDRPVYRPAANARVSGQDASGQAFMNGSQVEAVTGADGRFTLFDPRYIGGPFTLSAKHIDPDTGVERVTSASGFESDPQDAKAVALIPEPLRPYPNRATLNLNFDPVEAPLPPPEIGITVCELTTAGCVSRSDLALVGRRLQIRAEVTVESGASIDAGEVNGAAVAVVLIQTPDTTKKIYELQTTGGTDTAFTPSTPGSYVVRVRALTSQNDPRVETLTFRVVSSTGAVTALPNDAPQVITRKSRPENGAANVSVANLYPEIYFTEPVKGLVSGQTVTLEQIAGENPGPVDFDLIGVGVDALGVPVIIKSVTGATLMTSITLKPKQGLKLAAQYRLSLTAGIVDTDDPAKPLAPVQITFGTFTPTIQGPETGGFGSPGIGIVGNLAFVVKNNFINGLASVWSVEDPTAPRNLTTSPLLVAPRPIDVSADPTGLPMAAVSVVSTNVSKPSSVIFVSGALPQEPVMTGAVTVAPSAVDGFITRSAFHKGFVYLATTKKGVQIVDAERGQNIPDIATEFRARSALYTDGHSFGEDALVRTVPYPTVAGGRLVNMTDIVAADIQGQALVAATGTLPLLLVDPQQGTVTAHWQPSTQFIDGAPIVQGYALGLGRVGAYDLAAIAVMVDDPSTASKVRLIVVNVRNAASPEILGSVDLNPDGAPLDVTLRGTTAVVTTQENNDEGEAIIVELVDPAHPYVKGRVPGAGGRAAINQDGQIVTTASSPFGGSETPIGGIKTLVLESACVGLGSLQTRRVVQYRIFDPDAGFSHVEDARIRLNLCQRSEVTLRIDGQIVTTRVNSLTQQTIDKRDMAAGAHSFLVPADTLPQITDERTFTVLIRSVVDEEERTLDGLIVGEIRNRSMLPVSHTFVKGVDLFDGHLTMGGSDMQVKGRHFTLDLSRSYSSAGLGEGKSGWTWSYDSVISYSDNIYNVITADGSSQRFTTPDDGQTFVPQKGYHSKLARGGDGELVFTDKAANKHSFLAASSDTWDTGPWRLDAIEEPHGDRLEMRYNVLGRIRTVTEYWKGNKTPAASMTFSYAAFRDGEPGQPVDPKDMALETVVGQAADQVINRTVVYEHSSIGELRKVTRRGKNIAGGPDAIDEVWEYRYQAPSGRDANKLEKVIDPDGHSTSYAYYGDVTFSPSEGDVTGREEFVRTVTQSPGGTASPVVTTFDYGTRSQSATSSTTTVTDPRGNNTVYTMNRHGGVTTIAEPLLRTTVFEWMTADVLKLKESLPGGVVKDYEYDVNGNLTKETVTGADGLVATTQWVHDLRFNRPTRQEDAERRVSIWALDPATGDVTSAKNPVDDVTSYVYDSATGLLQTETDPRGVTTTYSNNNALGMWTSRTSIDPLASSTSVTARRVIDGRGRVTLETDGLGGETAREFDGLDRPLVQRRVAKVTALGGTSQLQDPSGEVTTMTYTRGGHVKTIRNSLGAVTTNTIDGMNRVIGTSTPVNGGAASMTITTATEYDGNGNVTKTTDPRGVVRQNVYDPLNRLSSVAILAGPEAGPTGTVASYTYKGATDLKETETDLSGNTTTFVYDGLFRMRQRQAAEPGYVEHFDYDRVGNVVRQTDVNGKVTTMAYDSLNRPTKVTRDFGGPSESFVETKYEESSVSHVFKTEEYDSLKKLRVRYAHDVAGREVARAHLLEGVGSVEAVAGTARNAAESSANAAVLSLFGSVPPTAPVRYLEAYGRQVGTAAGTVATTILEPSITLQGIQRSVKIETDGLGREVSRKKAALAAMEVKYNGLGGKTELKDENGNVSIWKYDTAGRLVGTTDAENKSASYKLDAAGNRIEETDRRGVVKRFTYDNLNRPLTTTVVGSLSGNPWTEAVEYLDSTRQRRVTDARGTVTLTTNDRLGRPRTIEQFGTEEGGGNRSRAITYEGANKKTESDWMGNVTTFEYDGLHRMTKAIDPAPFATQTVETTYDDANNRTAVKDRRGNRTVTQADSLGRVVWVRKGACLPDGSGSSGVTGGGAGTEGQTCEQIERNEYDGSGNKVLTADGRGFKTRFEYDAANRMVARGDAFEAVVATDTTLTKFILDDGGRVREEHRGRLAALEPAVTYGYDKVNRVVSETNGEGQETVYGYDPEGNRTSVTPPAQPATVYEYDELGKLTKVTQPATDDHAAAETQFSYDANRNKQTQTDARGNTTTYQYDRANRLKAMLEPGNLTTLYAYDANGNALTVTDANGQTEASTYDQLNRKKATTYAASPNSPSEAWREVTRTDYVYDANGNRERVDESVAAGTDPPGTTSGIRSIIQTFDALDRVHTETTTLPDGGVSKTVTYEYFENGTRKAVTLDTKRTAYDYDAQNRVKSMTTSDNVATQYTYYPDDLLRETTTPNGVKATRQYDKAGRLLSLTNAKGTVTTSSYGYTYDTNGNRLTQSETNPTTCPPPGPPPVPEGSPSCIPVEGTELTSYTYDADNRLKSVTYPADATYPNGRKVTYRYDKAGNREHETETTAAGVAILERAGTFDENNRLTILNTTVDSSVIASEPTGSRSNLAISYDPNGNETVRLSTTQNPPDAQGNPQAATVTNTQSIYDLKDRLVEQTREGQILTRHEYDAEGRRTKKIGEEGIRQYVYDDTSLLAEYSTDGTEIAKYDYGADRLIRLTRADEGTRYMTFDGLGSVTGLTNVSGDVTASYHLDAWGNYRFTSELTTSHNRFGFTGHYWDKEASLYYAKARYYDPFTARFTQADSFLGTIDDPPSLHRYFYANANPTMFVDPTGHDADKLFAAVIAGFEYTSGAVGAYIDNFTGGVLPRRDPYFESDAFVRGQMKGDELSMAQGGYEVITGAMAIGTGTTGGSLALATVAGAPLAIPAAGAIGVGAAGVGHGGMMMMKAQKGRAASQAVLEERGQAVTVKEGSGGKPDARKPDPEPKGAGESPKGHDPEVLKAGSEEHRTARWAEYQARGGKWSQERWNTQYEANMSNPRVGLDREALYREALGGENKIVQTPYGQRQIDVMLARDRHMVQVKSGPESLTTTGRSANTLAIQKDAWLVKQGYEVEWVLEKGGSKPLLKALEDAGIRYHVGPLVK
jgi:RHS repeat-associated protein